MADTLGDLRLGHVLDKAQAQLVEHLIQDFALFGGQVAAGLRFQQRQDLDHLRRAVEVGFSGFAGNRIGQIPEVDRGRARQREHERREGQLRLRLGHLIKITPGGPALQTLTVTENCD